MFVLGRFTIHEPSEPHVYPRLTRLIISQRCMPAVRHFVAAFPSLRVLHFDYTLFPWGTSSTPSNHSLLNETAQEKTAEQIRWHNQEDLNSSVDRGARWNTSRL